ncbi:DUF7275 domain-containing protein [Nocardia jiangxiensis]|uniref:DUF7275 domain-containing protein n=1 Tax=Nocardia jiangxiensis TaxID=282685 RepID=UPI000594D519|nr:hypothetical protein [Nocardia jiangxiensis]
MEVARHDHHQYPVGTVVVYKLIIGSTALGLLGFDRREPKDVDVFTDHPGDGEDAFWDPAFADWLVDGEIRVATLDEMYTIKLSHSYWELRNGSWGKHMSDLVWLQGSGGRIIQPLHDMLYGAWERRHGTKKVDLTQESDEFFSDAVRRKYDHDSLHLSVAYGDRPIYESCLKDGKTVQMDMQKVWAMPFEKQVQLFREEVYVTALERIVIPDDYTGSARGAYAWALRRTITSLTKGRSAQFIAENYKTFRTPDIDYVQHHLSKKHLLIPLEITA